MKLDQDNIAGLIFLVFGITVLSIITVGSAWDSQQTRVMYSNAYAKNQQCRIAYKGSDYRYIDTVCGSIPQFGDYRK